MAALRGSCQCRGVQFELPESFEARTFCHCTTCKKLSGGVGTANGRIHSDEVNLLEGEELLRTYQPEEGSAKTFCSVCGSNLFGGGWPESAQARVLERALEEGRRKPVTLVLDVELHGPVDRRRAQVHAAAAVAERVVDEVAERLLEAKAVAADDHSRGGFVGEWPRTLLRAPPKPVHDGRKKLVRIERVEAQWRLPPVGSRDQQKVLGELRQAVHFLRRPAQRLAELLRRAAVVQSELELRPEEREWRAKLVSGVRDEVALALERVFKSLEHLVQRLPEPLDLVPGPRYREPLARRLGRDRGGAADRKSVV